jgi:hypothetical protein
MYSANNYMGMQDLQGIAPVMQNTQGQQSSAQQALQQGQLLGQQALGTPQQIQMANALRQKNNNQPQPTKLSFDQMYEVARLGSNPFSSTSDYMTGANGWGNYGE